jgi:hypothetical protein
LLQQAAEAAEAVVLQLDMAVAKILHMEQVAVVVAVLVQFLLELWFLPQVA